MDDFGSDDYNPPELIILTTPLVCLSVDQGVANCNRWM